MPQPEQLKERIEAAIPEARAEVTDLTGGGDGTFTNVVTQVVKTARARGVKPPRFGLLRLGTGNALSWVVGSSGSGTSATLSSLL